VSIIKFSSMTNAARGYSALRSAGISSRIEKGNAGGCAFRLVIDSAQRQRAAEALRRNGVPFSL